MRLCTIASLFLLYSLVQAQEVPTVTAGTTAPTNAPTAVINVANDTKLIEGKSLAPWSGLAHPDSRMAFEGSNSGAVGDPRPSGPMFQDAAESRSNGIRLYGFTLAPKEKLALKLGCENIGKITMKFAPPVTADSMVAEFRKANMPPRPVRCSRISIQNITDKPYQVVLSLLGQANYSYKLEIERK